MGNRIDMTGLNIGLYDSDNTRFPNLALMKLSRLHKGQGDNVSLYSTDAFYDVVYVSKVFTYTQNVVVKNSKTVITSGIGSDSNHLLDPHVEHLMPDYNLYGIDYSLGFTTRGCNRNCPWCFVPKTEGKLAPHADVDEFLAHKDLVLMDNNPLASEHGKSQMEKLIGYGVKVDYNQGLDARLIGVSEAKLLSKLKWLKPIRLACDTPEQMKPVENAVRRLRWENATPRRYFCYVLIQDNMEEALERIKFLKGLNVDPFAQPFIDDKGTPPKPWQRHLARWVNNKAEYNTRTFEEYLTSKTGDSDDQ